jgi:hypothetical protein
VESRRGAPTDAARLTFRPLTVQRGIIQGARFEPDGQSILYSASWDGRPPEVFETRPGVPVGKPLGVVGAHLLSAARPGMAVVLLDQARVVTTWGALAEVPVTGGAPRRIHGDVWTADWNTGARTLAIVRRAGAMSRLEMPPGRVLHESGGRLGYVRVSHAGRWIAIVSNPVPGDTRGSVAILDTTGRIVSRAHQEWNYVGGIAWRADDREVWFCASGDAAATEVRTLSVSGAERVVARLPGLLWFEDMNRNGDVLVTSQSGQGGIRGLAPLAREEAELGWFDAGVVADISDDGRQLLFYETGIFGGNVYAACLRSMDGAPPVKLGEGLACALSPDGAWALAIQLLQPHRLVRLPTGAGDSSSFPRGAVERYEGAGWLPDGKGIVFAGSEPGRGRRTYVQDLVGGLPRPISPEGIAGWHVSPDGRFVAALGADRRLYACPMSGDSGRVVTQLEPDEQVLRWTRDGQAVYVQRPGIELRVSRITIATGERTPWRTYGLPDPAGANIANSAITADGRAFAYTYAKVASVLNLVTGLK